MTPVEIEVNEEGLEVLRKSVVNNGGKIIDPNFEDIKRYLELNPPVTGSLKVGTEKPAFVVK